ncbi:MAG TPA: metallophosphoesterase, partial [Arachidicoccus sp.]
EHYNWIFNKGHLVVNGDLFDRGDEVTPLLWLIYKLEEEAKSKGGYVHTIIGNHDVMNLAGDVRFVNEKYFEHAKLMGIDYMQLFDEHTELGRWLRTKNVMEKIGNRLFVHGGVSPLVNDLKLSIEDINDKCRPFYDKIENSEAERFQSLYNRQALYWYRGYFTQPRAVMKDIDDTLNFYGCKQIVVGHTILSDRNPALYYEGKVLGIDVNHHKGIHAAVLLEDSYCYAVNDKGNKILLNYKPENDIISSDVIG